MHKFYDTQTDFQSCSRNSGWLPLVKGLYYSQEKGLSLLLKKRMRKTKEHALHDSTNVVYSRYYIPRRNLVPYIRKTANC